MIRRSVCFLRHVEAFCFVKNLISRILLWVVARLDGKLFLSSFFFSSFPHRYKVRTSDISRLLPKPRFQRRQPRLADTIRLSLMLCSDASLVEDLLREYPASRKLKFLNGSSRRVTEGHVHSRSMNTRLSSFTGFTSVRPYVRPITGDPADHLSIPAVYRNPFSRGIVRDLYPWR